MVLNFYYIIQDLINTTPIKYTIRRHPRARRLRLTVTRRGEVILTVPQRVSLVSANYFLEQHSAWVNKKIEEVKSERTGLALPYHLQRRGAIDLHRYKARAKALIIKTVRLLNAHYKFDFKKISVRNQSSRWGSCSKEGNLNFNFRLFWLEEKLLHYVVVHELCHLKEMNHSARFWKLVSETIPDYQACRRALRQHHL